MIILTEQEASLKHVDEDSNDANTDFDQDKLDSYVM